MCGIVGIFGHPEASTLAYLSLYALQHRGDGGIAPLFPAVLQIILDP